MKRLPVFFDKELSWLAFNERVLQEAADANVPLIERIRFLGIYSANLDEFFRVRVANIRRKALLESASIVIDANSNDNTISNVAATNPDNSVWQTLLTKIMTKVETLTDTFRQVALETFAELNNHGIHLLFNNEDSSNFQNSLNKSQMKWLQTFFEHRVIRHITPIIITHKTQLAECLDDDGIYFLVGLKQQEDHQFALIEIPRSEVDRFIILPHQENDSLKHIVMLDDIIHYFIDDIFASLFTYESIDAYSIKLTRDSDYNLNSDLDDSLLEKMSKGLKQRLKSDPVRLGYDKKMPDYMLKFLRKNLRIKAFDNLVPGVRFRHFKDFLNFPNLGDQSLENPPIQALEASNFKHFPSIFQAISHSDILVYYPYYKFKHFTEFVRQSSYDPLVKEIKINIYRVAKKSQIIHSLIEAVKNGKQVTVVVELMARFDEEANIEWAKLLKDAGVNVEFGIPTLKIHSKLCMVTRLENDKIVHYAHLGTGNFHERNARVYTDFSLFTKQKEICREVDNIFSFIAHSYKRFRFNHLIVSPLTSRRKLYQLIDNEIEHARAKKEATITLKLNDLVDEGLITHLYKASNAGVKIRLIIRGMCSLVPGLPNLSKNITVISIVDKFLEHPRVMIFNNNAQPLVYISSADWMERNIDQRVEVACPIYDPQLKKRIIDIIELHFQDNCKARIINQEQDNTYQTTDSDKTLRSQTAIYDYLVNAEANEKINLKLHESSCEIK